MPHNEPRYCSRSCLGYYSTSQVTPLAICCLFSLSYRLDLSSEVRNLLDENACFAVKAGIEVRIYSHTSFKFPSLVTRYEVN